MIDAERSNDTYRRLIARFQSLERVVLRRDDRIELFVVAQYAHERSVADRAHEVLFPVFRLKQIDDPAILAPCSYSEVRVLSRTGYSVDRLGHKGDLKTVHAEYISDDMFYLRFVISSLHR